MHENNHKEHTRDHSNHKEPKDNALRRTDSDLNSGVPDLVSPRGISQLLYSFIPPDIYAIVSLRLRFHEIIDIQLKVTRDAWHLPNKSLELIFDSQNLSERRENASTKSTTRTASTITRTRIASTETKSTKKFRVRDVMPQSRLQCNNANKSTWSMWRTRTMITARSRSATTTHPMATTPPQRWMASSWRALTCPVRVTTLPLRFQSALRLTAMSTRVKSTHRSSLRAPR